MAVTKEQASDMAHTASAGDEGLVPCLSRYMFSFLGFTPEVG